MLAEHREPVHIPSPAVPCRDERAHDHAIDVGDEQASRHISEQPVDILGPVGEGRVRTAVALPQTDDRRCIGCPGCAYRVFLLSQADTIAMALMAVSRGRLRSGDLGCGCGENKTMS